MDLKNLNLQNKKLVTNLIIIIVSLIVAFNIYKAQNQEAAKLKERYELETKKNALLTQISAEESELKTYRNTLNKKDASAILNAINMAAKNADIKIVSLRPQEPQVSADLTKYAYDLNLGAKSYHVLGAFISELESSDLVFIVENISINPNSAINEQESISAVLKVSTVMLPER